MTAILLLLAGLVMLGLGGDVLVRGAVGIARRFGLSPLLIGLTLVGFGTSMPELATSLQANLGGSPDVAIGNVVGSNIANILLILGIAAVIRPIACDRAAFRRDGPMLAASQLAMAGVILTGMVGRVEGAVMLAALLAYTGFCYVSERRAGDAGARMHAQEAELPALPHAPLWLSAAMALGGIALTILGARLLVDGAIDLARAAGISEAVIGLTLVAVGTSLPELATAIVAALRRQGDVAFGNVIGSNIFNALGILGATALALPLPAAERILAFDLWVMLGVAALAILATMTGWRIDRREGLLFLAGYAAYLAVLAGA
ncbi:MAG: calcium/sodium antiporter [Alphaproteobacteria bacterium]|jgi:cation:H+ antiporter|nr:calcium/sodium antiporter [Alphaproteobacteria bacterium]